MNKIILNNKIIHAVFIILSLAAVIVFYHRIIFIKYAEEKNASNTDVLFSFFIIGLVFFFWCLLIFMLYRRSENKKEFLLYQIPVDLSITANIIIWLDHIMVWEFWLYKLAAGGEVFLLSYLFFVSKRFELKRFAIYMASILAVSLMAPREAYIYENIYFWVFPVIAVVLSVIVLNVIGQTRRIDDSKGYFVYVSVLVFFSAILIALVSWYSNHFGVSLDEILFTVFSPMDGANASFLLDAAISAVKAIIIATGIILSLVYVHRKEPGTFAYRTVGIASIVLFVFALRYLDWVIYYIDYVRVHLTKTTLYEEYYIDPKEVSISEKEKKNLIYIYVESLENTYASDDVGGFQGDHNYIPKLTQLAGDNISFSNSDKLGGFHGANKTGWTMAGIFSTSSGINWCIPVANNNMRRHEEFVPKLTTLGDILEEKGYYQEFLCGSNAAFGGRTNFFEEHGGYDIFDYNTAIQKGYIDEDYHVWWGYEDRKLYEIAKDELLRLSSLDVPFNLTVLTADTHPVSGYFCELCEDEYPDQLANVLVCADKQLVDFINWCKKQDFYDDSLIVIIGDHLRMDEDLVDGIDTYDRTVYNCFINPYSDDGYQTKNREFTHMDLFPTVLSAMGYEIEGDRLGLGTNLFSDRPTLAEELGYEELNRELGYYSEYYKTHFY